MSTARTRVEPGEADRPRVLVIVGGEVAANRWRAGRPRYQGKPFCAASLRQLPGLTAGEDARPPLAGNGYVQETGGGRCAGNSCRWGSMRCAKISRLSIRRGPGRLK